MKRLFTIFLLRMVFFTTSVFGQDSPFKFEYLSSEEGFKSTFVDALMQDQDGYLWINSWDGLFRYDGYQFKHYKYLPDDTTYIASTALYQDRSGNFWVGTHHTGILRYNKELDNFTHFDHDPKDPNGVGSHFTSVILEDSRGNLWVGTNGEGVKWMNADRKTFTSFPFNQEGNQRSLRGEKVRAIYEDSKGRIWIGTGSYFESMKAGGLNRFDYADSTFKHYTYQPEKFAGIRPNRVESIYEDSFGTLWVGTAPDGLFKFDEERDRLVKFRYDFVKAEEWNVTEKSVVRFIHEHKATRTLWIGLFGKGIFTVDLNSGKSSQVLFDQNNRFSISHDNVWGVVEDRQGLLWIGTVNGLNKVNPVQKRFVNYANTGITDATLTSNFVQCIYQDSKGGVWIGTNNGLNKWNREDGTFQRYFEDRANPLVIHAITEDEAGSVWMATNKGLKEYDLKSRRFNQLPSSSENPELPLGNYVYDLMRDASGNIWMTTEVALNKFVPSQSVFIKYHYPEDLDAEQGILYRDFAGTIWVSVGRTRVITFDEESGSFDNIFEKEIMVYDFLEDSQNRFWMCTNASGLLLYDRPTGQFEQYEVKNGLTSNTVSGIIEDDRGMLWVSTNNGISLFDPNNELFKSFVPRNGLSISRPGFPHKNESGEVFFGGTNGFTVFDPKDYSFDSIPPTVELTQLKIFNELAVPRPGSVIDKSIALVEEIHMSHEQNDLTFDFVGLNFSDPNQNRYKIKLDNYDREWIDVGVNRSARYTNLSDGKYNFQVISANADGIWTENSTSLKLIISPPWWRTWWSYVLYTVVLVNLVYFLRRYDLRRIRLKNHLEMKSLEAERLAAVDQMKSRFFANISHEFRTPLTLILGPLKDLINKSEKGSFEHEQYAVMQRNANRLHALINQLLDLSKLEAGSMKLELVKTDLNAFLRPIVASFSSLAQNKSIRFSAAVPEVPMEMVFDPDKLEKIINNLLSNAFKFTPQGGEVNVSIRACFSSNTPLTPGTDSAGWVEIVVQDNGPGIPVGQIDKIFDRFYQVDDSQSRAFEGSGIGLALTKELVELHNGEISLSSSPNEQTTFTIKLMIDSDLEHDEAKVLVEKEESDLSLIYDRKVDEAPDAEAVEGENLILVVEDNPDLRAYITQHFQSSIKINNPKVLEAKNGEEGLKKALEYVPDMIISDLMMPDMDGLEMCHALKTDEKTSHIPIILLTAKADHKSRLEGLEMGADDYIAKPFEAEELILKVANQIEHQSILKKKFSQVVTLGPRKINIQSIDQRFLERVQAIIDQHMANSELDVNHFSRQLGMSRSQFYRKLKGLLGLSPNEFIRDTRLVRALQLVEQNFGSVAEVAYAVGFNNLSYFTKCFKEKYGKLPSEYVK